ncbi:unnamed protein product [Symbiodinium natans]|uniref:Uncharacterized protein n=1 Tax=Symbiodinium natans TaxID=878477 RepID=A0A812IXQ6_9DINO|nr:unnamed protein product [Symbiodinium natans]
MVQPACEKQARLVLATCDLLASEIASPAAVNALLGLQQWFCLLQRGMLSIFSEVYNFVREQPESEKRRVPASVLDELFVSLALAPLLPASLDREFLPEVLACDAAPEYGFGVTLVQCGKRMAERVGRLSERRGDYVRLEHSAEDPPEVERLGTLHRMPFKKTDFKQLISCKARWSGHSGLLECHGVLLSVKWIARSRRRHHRRAVILVDAKTAIGSVAKGRSSARSLRRVLRSIAGHALAADLLLTTRLMGLQGEGVLLGESGAPTTSGDPDFGDVFHRQEFFMHAMTDVPLTLTAMQPGLLDPTFDKLWTELGAAVWLLGSRSASIRVVLACLVNLYLFLCRKSEASWVQGRSTRSCCGCFVSSLALLFQPRSPDVRPHPPTRVLRIEGVAGVWCLASAGQLSDNPGKWKPDKVFEPLGANCTILTVRHSFESQRDKTAIEGKQLMEWCQDTVEYTFAYQNQSTAYSESPLLSRRNDRKYKLFSPMADVCHGAAGYRDPVCGHLCSVGQEVFCWKPVHGARPTWAACGNPQCYKIMPPQLVQSMANEKLRDDFLVVGLLLLVAACACCCAVISGSRSDENEDSDSDSWPHREI